ncbi:DsbA family protein [Undibacterium sp. TS12]|uniref:DsbA family protein n=1 Tax=Undibacterium sp. TS12 TaxID=2908202 RepID=UPI001F4D04FD|nr:DsbA family protein [Undibacterium sp. TS12]MCH8619245.1 DsbA family protein [Undibacterium sp. TS12]
MIRLHMIFDPLCGWCYAASPLLRKVQAHFSEQLSLVFHPGLLFAQANIIPASYREHIIAADQHIATLSGVHFGPAYLQKIRTATELSYNSVPASIAVMSVVDATGSTCLQMLEKIQHAHYVDAADVSDVKVLTRLAQEIGLEEQAFKEDYACAESALQAQARQARQLLDKVAARGFPTFVLETAGQYVRLNHSVAYQDSGSFFAEIERAGDLNLSTAT